MVAASVASGTATTVMMTGGGVDGIGGGDIQARAELGPGPEAQLLLCPPRVPRTSYSLHSEI
jgi:hypothetical protein